MINKHKHLLYSMVFCLFGVIACSLCGCKWFNGGSDEQQGGGTSMSKGTTMLKSDSGLEWEVLQKGSGNTPEPGKTVTVHYTGWLDEAGEPGKKFDSSVDRNQKFSFQIGIGMVIAGWDEGVMGMKIGEKRRLYIPADLGYGSRGAGASIPPNSALIFDVELFEVA